MTRLLTFKQLSEKLGARSRSSIYRDVDRGRLPRPFKFGVRIYWSEEEIDAAVQNSRDLQAAGKAGLK